MKTETIDISKETIVEQVKAGMIEEAKRLLGKSVEIIDVKWTEDGITITMHKPS